MNKHANRKIERIWEICIEQIHCFLNRKIDIFIIQTKDDLLECSKDLDIDKFVVGMFRFWVQEKLTIICELYIIENN